MEGTPNVLGKSSAIFGFFFFRYQGLIKYVISDLHFQILEGFLTFIKIHSSSHHPETNRESEKNNQLLQQYFRCKKIGLILYLLLNLPTTVQHTSLSVGPYSRKFMDFIHGSYQQSGKKYQFFMPQISYTSGPKLLKGTTKITKGYVKNRGCRQE